MARYTIDGQILTDLGDIVRGAKFGGNPREVYTGHTVYQGFEGVTQTRGITYYTDYAKTKVTILSVNWTANEDYSAARLYLTNNDWNAPTAFYVEGTSELPYTYFATPGVQYEGRYYVSITAMYGAADVTYMVEPCDDNGEVIKSTYTPDEIVDEISAFPLVPPRAFEITGSFNYKFANNGWNWFIETCGDLVSTKEIGILGYGFYSSSDLKSIPFELNISDSCINFSNCFYRCNQLTAAPRIVGSVRPTAISSYTSFDFTSAFQDCQRIRELPDDYFTSFASQETWANAMNNTNGARNNLFYGCYSLRKLPDISVLATKSTSSYNLLTTGLAYACYSLDEITNLPVLTIGSFNNIATNCYRLKDFTFAVQEDGTPFEVNWSNVSIQLGSKIGYGYSSSYFYNSGITNAKQVSDVNSYNRLKDDPDWWTSKIEYSRFNHDSAVRTIQSLPNRTSGIGTCNIVFEGEAGLYTDGGAINKLTEAEIAVAAAKGWTVSIT